MTTGTVTTSIALLLLPIATAVAGHPEPKTSEIDGHIMYTLLEPGEIPAIFNPRFVAIDEADLLYHDNEPLMVVTSGEETKAYSTWHLDQREIVNDYIDGRAITITW